MLLVVAKGEGRKKKRKRGTRRRRKSRLFQLLIFLARETQRRLFGWLLLEKRESRWMEEEVGLRGERRERTYGKPFFPKSGGEGRGKSFDRKLKININM